MLCRIDYQHISEETLNDKEYLMDDITIKSCSFGSKPYCEKEFYSMVIITPDGKSYQYKISLPERSTHLNTFVYKICDISNDTICNSGEETCYSITNDLLAHRITIPNTNTIIHIILHMKSLYGRPYAELNLYPKYNKVLSIR